MKAIRDDSLRIKIVDDSGGSIQSQSVEANLLYMILKQLETLNGNVIDVETAVDKIDMG